MIQSVFAIIFLTSEVTHFLRLKSTSRIRSRLRVDLPLRKLFEAPTVEQLSRLILAVEKKPGEVEKTARVVLKNCDGLAK